MDRKNFNVNYHITDVNFSEKALLEYAADKRDWELQKEIEEKIKNEKSKTFLSKIMYYQTIQ
jgi:hypothetical protein